MKKVFLTAAVVVSAFFAKAQSTSASGVVIKGGYNMSNITTSKDGKVDEAQQLSGFHIGATIDLPLAKNVYLQPGLLYTTKGSKIQDGQPTDANYYKSTFNPHYLEIPVNLVTKFDVGSDTKLFLGAGPYVAMGIGGQSKTEGKFLGVAFNNSKNIEFSNDDPSTTNYEENSGINKVKRFDAGFNFSTGVEVGKTIISLNYGLGLNKIQSGSDNSSNDANKHRVLSLSVGFKL